VFDDKTNVPKNMKIVRIVSINLLSLAFLLIIFELFLNISSLWFPRVDLVTRGPDPQWWELHRRHNRIIIDPRNGYTGDPSYPEHDAWGFRNESIPTEADIIALGDSWTYGAVVNKEDVWPVLLAEMSNRDVYNMGMGGTGLINYYQTFEKSLQLNPKYIIVSFYFGNDFFTTVKRFHMDDAHKIFGIKALELEAKIREKETNNPVNGKELRAKCKYKEQNEDKTQIGEQGKLPSNNQGRENNISSIDNMRYWLSENSRLYGLLWSFKNYMEGIKINDKIKIEREYRQRIKASSEEQQRSCFQFTDGDWKTVFENSLRTRLLNSHDVRTRTALDVAKNISGEMNSTIKELGGEFLVVLFPTKETVFSNRINTENIPVSSVYSEMESITRSEKYLKDSLIEYFDKEGIAYVDMLPHLQGAGSQPFFGHSDSHPNEFGNLVIARTINDFINRQSVGFSN